MYALSPVLAALTVLLMAASPVVAPGASAELSHPACIYDYSARIESTGTLLILTGSQTALYEGTVDLTIGDETREAVKHVSSLSAGITGTMRFSAGFPYPPYVTVDVHGKYTFRADSFYDLGSGKLVRQVTTECLDIRSGDWQQERVLRYYYEKNVTDFAAVVVSPPGMDESPIGFGLPVGTCWTVEFLGTYESTSASGSALFEASSDVHRAVNYTYVGEENLTVPAGTFRCMRLEVESGGRNKTHWHAPAIGESVKARESYEGFEETLTLASYEPGEPARGGDPGSEERLDMLMLGVAVSAAAVAATVLLWVKRSRTDDEEDPPGPAEVG